MRDVYLWTGLAVASLIAAAAVVALVRRWLDWQDRRTATAPTVFHTEVQEPLATGGILPPGQWYTVGEDVPPLVVPLHPHPTEPVWAVEAFMAARRLADERLEEFARPTHAVVAPIWAELDGIFTARGLVTV